MKIYLLKTADYSEEEFNAVHSLLETFEGVLEFLKVDVDFDKEKFPFLKKFNPDFKFKYLSDIAKIGFDADRSVPLSWLELFSLCNHYRRTFDIQVEDFVVLLTNRRNALNWFSAFDGFRNIFVHTNEWSSFTDTNPKYPIGYQIIENIMGCLMKLDIHNLENSYIHTPPKGCMNDFCRNKEDVILKLQTANICSKCMERIQREGINGEIIDQVFRIFECVRSELIFKKRTQSQKEIAALPITITKKNTIIIEKINLELRLTPLHKTLYIFYLKQKNGVLFKDMIDYKPELMDIYGKLSVSDNLCDVEKRIKCLVNPLDNSFNELKAKINKTIIDLLGAEMAAFYKIDGSKGKPFKINLHKDYIQFQE